MSQYDKFHGYLTELHENHARLAKLLQDKLEAVEKFDMVRLDDIIKEEQVYVLLSKSFDANVARYREQLSLSGEKLSDIIEELPEEEQQRFRAVFRCLQSSLAECQALNENCQTLLEGRLHGVNKSIKELDKTAANTYSKAGAPPKGAPDANPHFLAKSV